MTNSNGLLWSGRFNAIDPQRVVGVSVFSGKRNPYLRVVFQCHDHDAVGVSSSGGCCMPEARFDGIGGPNTQIK
eukprot:2858046-Alexandrium_andersonii.AAC.1